MTSERSPEPDPRRKRAFLLGGALVVAAIAWNASDDDDVHITIADDGDNMHEARDAIRSSIREEIRAGFRDDADATEDAAEDEASDDATDEDAAATEESDTAVADDGEARLVETDSGENQRSFRIEGDDGRGVTISLDADPAE